MSLLNSTVVPVMNGHPRDQAKVSVHCRWPLVTGTDGQAGHAKYNTPCNICRTGSAATALHDVLRPDGTAPLFFGPK